MKWALVAILVARPAQPLSLQNDLPEGEGKDLVVRLCTSCHGIEEVISARKSEAVWSNTVDAMVQRGATGKDEEFDLVIKYLAKNFGATPQPAQKINVNKATAKDLSAALELSPEEADLIVQYREKNGPFKSIGDLARVSGLDMKKIEAKRERVEF
jgi:competence ComEA-like helix-hairpin-helix protein